MAAITVRVSEETDARLDQLALKLDRPKSSMAEQAIEDFVAREVWQVVEIEAAVAEADRGDFASAEDLASVLAKFLKPAL